MMVLGIAIRVHWGYEGEMMVGLVSQRDPGGLDLMLFLLPLTCREKAMHTHIKEVVLEPGYQPLPENEVARRTLTLDRPATRTYEKINFSS